MRSRASKRAVLNRTPTPGPSKRRRQASPGSVESGAYCGMDADVKKERSSTSSPAESHGPASSSKRKKRQKTAALQARRHSADEAGEMLETPLIRPEQPSNIVAGPSGQAPNSQALNNQMLVYPKNEYAFVTLAKALPTALSFEPALQEVVGDLLASVTMGAGPSKLSERITERCWEVRKAEAGLDRVEQVRGLLKHKLQKHLTALLSAVSPAGENEQGMMTPPTSAITTPKSQDNRVDPDWSPPQTPALVDRAIETNDGDNSGKTARGKLKKVKQKRKSKDQNHNVTPRSQTALSDSALASSEASPNQITAAVAAVTSGPSIQSQSGCDVQIRRPFDEKYWSQPTFLRTEKHRIPPDAFYVLIPFGTPDLPFNNAKPEEVQTACATAFAKLKTFQRVFPWGSFLWVAAFTSRTEASAAQRTKLWIRDVSCRPVHLTYHATPKTFRFDFCRFGAFTLQELAKAFFDAREPYCGSSNQVQLRLQACDGSPRGRQKLVAYFDSTPGLLRFYIPIQRRADEPFVLRFVPLDVARECWLCKIHHRGERCPMAMIVQRPA